MSSLSIKDFNIEELSWNEARQELQQVNTKLAHICDERNLSKGYSLFKITYPYGALIVDQGIFCLPTKDHGLLPINSLEVPTYLQEQLNYSFIPLSVVLDNTTEVFMHGKDDSVNSLNFFTPGDLFGLFELMNMQNGTTTRPIWSVSAGSRSVFMIPRVTDLNGHHRIKKEFNIKQDPPQRPCDHWTFFKNIYNKAGLDKKWSNTILVFSKKWAEEDKSDISSLHFHRYLHKLYWNQTQLFRDIVVFDWLWASFNKEISKKNLKPRPYLVDTLKYLVSIANGSGVATRPATDNTSLPLEFLQNVYLNCYNLKEYIPTIMQPDKFSPLHDPVYYSLSFQSSNIGYLAHKNAPSIIEDERSIKRLMNLLNNLINNNIDKVRNYIKDASYDFFHTDLDIYGEIRSSKEIEIDDPRFQFYHCNFSEARDRIFCSSSLFFRGCIRISSASSINSSNKLIV